MRGEVLTVSGETNLRLDRLKRQRIGRYGKDLDFSFVPDWNGPVTSL